MSQLKHLKESGLVRLKNYDEFIKETAVDPNSRQSSIEANHPTDNPNNKQGEFVECTIKPDEEIEMEQEDKSSDSDLGSEIDEISED